MLVKRSYHLTTFGCQMNEHDSERMKGMLESIGYAEAPSRQDAELILFNTRSIRESADSRLVGHLGEAKRLKAEEEPPAYLPWGDEADLPKGAKASTLTADFGAHSTSWQFQKGGYVNTDSYAAEGDQFPADSVLVLRVRVGDAGYRDPSGYPVPETKFEGAGAAMLFHGGRVITGTWKKDGLAGAIELETKRGELKVPAGRVWVELVPAVDGNLTFAR